MTHERSQGARTSVSHPLQIAEVTCGHDYGRIGITVCPGKKQQDAWSGSWDRDLCLDLDVVESWGAAIVLSLIEPHELATLGVSDLGREVKDRHMEWIHLPIRDVAVPDEKFESMWDVAGESIRARLRAGFNILVHCKGGLGRAGTIAARLLVELGHEPAEAIAALRNARPGAIETRAQAEHVMAQRFRPAPQPARSPQAITDRATGALIGLAVGDAVGTTLEFKRRDSYPRLEDMVGGGPFNLKRGEWTDDTAMALALAESLIAHPDLDECDLMRRFIDWRDNGSYSCNGRCFDIGMTVAQALRRFEATGNPIAGSTDPMSAGNGSLMRLAPVAVRYWNDAEKRREIAARQSATTHAATEAVDACVAYADVIAEAIAGAPRDQVLRPRENELRGEIGPIMAGSWRGKVRKNIGSSGYVAHSLEAALWAVGRTGAFRDAVLLAANLGGDADTTAAIAGQLAGAIYGCSGIPEGWMHSLALRSHLKKCADQLVAAAR